MEKIAKYSHIIQSLLQEMATDTEALQEEVHEELVFDTVRHHYFIVWVGFTPKSTFMDKVIVHFCIKETGKIWVLANWTEDEVGEELIKRGVDRNDIVVGFQPQDLRIHTGYAVV
jgi:XisI protein